MHAEGDSPFVVKDDENETGDTGFDTTLQVSNLSNNYVECNVDGCGEDILVAELDAHLTLHAAQDLSEQMGHEDNDHPASLQRGQLEQGQPAVAAAWAQILKMPQRKHGSLSHLKQSALLRLGVCGSAFVIFPLFHASSNNSEIFFRAWSPCRREADARLA